ncbi:hypothetical protein V8F20_002332 [Naviculisporaceae sp. PSN 640]
MALRFMGFAARVGPTLRSNPRLRNFSCPQVLCSSPQRRITSGRPVPEVEGANFDTGIDAFKAQKPVVIRSSATSPSSTYLAGCEALKTALQREALPGGIDVPYELVGTRVQIRKFIQTLAHVMKWCEKQGKDNESENGNDLDRFAKRLLELQSELEVEFMGSPKSNENSKEILFLQFTAPFQLLVRLDYNFSLLRNKRYLDKSEQADLLGLPDLYIAQADLSQFSEKIPIPDFVTQAGKGDIYKSSFWMGLEPTCTPWHRDPNPNYFLQVKRSKAVRILPRKRGQALFDQAMATLPPAERSTSRQLRGAEMMQQLQRDALENAVWGPEAPEEMLETVLRPGDALFIPQGWWHSLRGGRNEEAKHLNFSINWWFR